MINYQPKPGAVVKCDFKGYIIPEMVKNRPVLVISSHKSNSKLVTIVPISATQPTHIESYHHELDLTVETNLAVFLKPMPRWFKCDLIYVVSIDRLDRLKNKSAGTWGVPHISIATLNIVKGLVRIANGL